MSKFKFRDKAMRFRSKKSATLEKMANNAVHEFKVHSFDTASFDGKSWAPIKDGAGRQPLVKTGRMRNGITTLRRTTDMRLIGCTVPYAAYHNSGTKNLPQRQFIGSTKRLRDKNRSVLQQYLKGL
jgi:phage gpG-like protein